jgi:hypothetical protein
VRDYPDTGPAVDDLKQAIALLGESGAGSKGVYVHTTTAICLVLQLYASCKLTLL